jgi:hypothetical protein
MFGTGEEAQPAKAKPMTADRFRAIAQRVNAKRGGQADGN